MINPIIIPTDSNEGVLPIIKPNTDSTTAVQITKADGTTAVLNVDTTNSRIGIGGFTDPQTVAEINTSLRVSIASSANGVISISRYNGTRSAPTAILNGEVIGSYRWSTQYSSVVGERTTAAQIQAVATGNHSTNTNIPTKITFGTGSTTESSTVRMTLFDYGLEVVGSVRIGNDSTVASSANVGAMRYRTSGNNSYVDMCMQTGTSSYAWINIVQNNW